MISYGSHWIDDEDIDAVVRVLKSNWLTQGSATPDFEESIANYVGVPEVVAVNSGTSALHIACLALDINCESEVWVAAISFVASANCAKYCGARIRFMDVDPVTGMICINALESALEKAEKANQLPAAIISVDMAGHPINIEKIESLKEKYGFYLISDSSHALGALYNSGRKVGSSPVADITVFSFHPVKIITTGEGGVAVTHNQELAHKMRLYRSHGISKDNLGDVPEWYYEQRCLGYNYRMSDIHAALGLSQLKKITKFIKIRKQLSEIYQELLTNVDVAISKPDAGSESSWHLFIIHVNQESTVSRDQVFRYLKSNGIGVQLHYIPIYKHPFYQNIHNDELNGAERYFESAITLPLHCRLDKSDLDNIVSHLKKGLGGAC